VRDVFEPVEDGKHDKCFISKGYDASTHFETTVDDVLDMCAPAPACPCPCPCLPAGVGGAWLHARLASLPQRPGRPCSEGAGASAAAAAGTRASPARRST
jgi:hypothetical protein